MLCNIITVKLAGSWLNATVSWSLTVANWLSNHHHYLELWHAVPPTLFNRTGSSYFCMARGLPLEISMEKLSYLPRPPSIFQSSPVRSFGTVVFLVTAGGSPCLRNMIFFRLPAGLSLFASSFLFSATSASFLSTCSCRHLNWSCVCAALQPDRMC